MCAKQIEDRGKWQDAFCEFLEDVGLDGYGHQRAKNPDFDTDMGDWIVRPYWWGECACDGEEPEPGCRCGMPNFEFIPWGYELRWYKYPLRSVEASEDLTFERFLEMLELCREAAGLPTHQPRRR